MFGSALAGRCKDRPDLVEIPLPLEVIIEVLPVKGGEDFLRSIFEPLGYNVEAQQQVLDEQFPVWGDSPYFSVKLSAEVTLSALLNHLYIFIPVFDNQKHYFAGPDELDKLLAKGEGWLAEFDAAAVVEVIEHLDPPRVKPLLYVYRVLLTGIHLMRIGKVESNLRTLNASARLSYLDEVIDRKLSGPEKGDLPKADIEFHEKAYERLVADREAASKTSTLPEVPSGKAALNDLLVRVRLREVRL